MPKILKFFLYVLIFTFVILTGNQPVFAATIPYTITTGIPGQSTTPGATFLTVNFSIDYQSGQMIFSGNPDGTGSTGVDDAAMVWVVERPDGTSASVTFRYDNGCRFISHKPPQDVTSLFKPGINQVQVKLYDICGVFIGSSSLYLVNTNAPDPTPTPTPLPSKTPLILIPGIGGSELKVEEDTIWNKDDGHDGEFNHIYPKDEVVWVNEDKARALGDDDYFDILRLKPDGITDEAKLELTQSIVDLVYQPTIDFFQDNDYIFSQNLFVFPYDWRKDLSLTTSQLDQKIDGILNQTGAERVDIVAHSMGGLVARNYITDASRASKVGKLVEVGVPHLGSVEFLKKLRYGGCLTREFLKRLPFCLGIPSSEIKDVLKNMTGAYQLTPSRKYFDFYTGDGPDYPYPIRDDADLDDNDITGVLNYDQTKTFLTNLDHNTSLFTPAEIFHNLDNLLDNTNGVDVTLIAGSGIDTIGQIIEKYKYSLSGDKIPVQDQIIINGDETVPLYSASLDNPGRNISLKGNSKVYYTKQNHGSLIINGPALNLVRNILNNDSAIPADVSTQPFKLKGKLLGVFSPINIHAYDSSGNHTGLLPNGDFEINIPGSNFNIIGDSKFIFLPDDGIYKIEFEATDQGSFDFRIREFENDTNTQTILYKDIPILVSSRGEAILDTNSSAPPTLQVDQKIINPTAILDQQASNDTTPPEVSIDANPKTLWPPNNKMIDITITGHSSDDHILSTKFFVKDEYGLVKPVITDFNQIIQLQASREGNDKDGRKYTIKAIAEDLAGNVSEAQVEIIVPHDQGDNK